ncbi:DUF4422 domain-containing protein [Helicobacter typhlonius]|uniref:DUF4422 domain-containing protein n=1 Tax=Helicobacter typhlonius TaxID=76936 RepID=UPI002FE148D1
MNIKILVCYHKVSPIIGNDVLQPILLGAANASEYTIGGLKTLCDKAGVPLLYDNSGEHISSLNPYFCELTAMYWAWKNLEADYYGLFHYRRVFDFRDSTHFDMPRTQKYYYDSIRGFFSDFYQQYGLNPQNIIESLKGYDIVLPTLVIDHDDKQRAQHLSLYELYDEVHYIKDMDLALEYIASKYPQMYQIALDTLHKKPLFWYIANMYIMKKALYLEYCEWIFDILFAIEPLSAYKNYDSYQARIFGFLAERLFNVWIAYKKTQKNLKIKELPLVFFKFRAKKRWFGWAQDGDVKQFYVCKLRVIKKYLGEAKS